MVLENDGCLCTCRITQNCALTKRLEMVDIAGLVLRQKGKIYSRANISTSRASLLQGQYLIQEKKSTDSEEG